MGRTTETTRQVDPGVRAGIGSPHAPPPLDRLSLRLRGRGFRLRKREQADRAARDPNSHPACATSAPRSSPTSPPPSGDSQAGSASLASADDYRDPATEAGCAEACTGRRPRLKHPRRRRPVLLHALLHPRLPGRQWHGRPVFRRRVEPLRRALRRMLPARRGKVEPEARSYLPPAQPGAGRGSSRSASRLHLAVA